jgi:hypothetical protein
MTTEKIIVDRDHLQEILARVEAALEEVRRLRKDIARA